MTLDEELVTAAMKGDLRVVKEKISNHANINTRNGAPLRHAILNGHKDVIDYLLDNNANIYIDDEYGGALSWAAKKGNVELVKTLLSKGAKANNKHVLLPTISANHVKVLEVLHDAGANINDMLALVSKKGSLKSINILLAAGADMRANNDIAIVNAIHNENKKVIELFINKYLAQDDGIYPLYHAAIDICNREKNTKVLSTFLNHGLNPYKFTPEMIQSWSPEKRELLDKAKKTWRDRSEVFAQIIYKNKNSELPQVIIDDILMNSARPKLDKIKDTSTDTQSSRGGAEYARYKGRKYKVRVGKKGGRYILVGKDKKKIYIY